MIRKSLISLAVLSSLLLVAAAPSEAGLRDRLRERAAERFKGKIANDKTIGGREIAYGSDPLQTLSIWQPSAKSAKPAPLIIFVHGGGWKGGDKNNTTGRTKVAHYTGQGFAFASINYRLVPAATVEQQAADVANAVAKLISQARALGIDPRRIILMGHSAGAHLVSLVGTDPAYFRAARLSESAVAGVIAVDGAAYDVPTQLTSGPRVMHDTYAQAFGDDPARQRALSPTLQAAAPNAPAFLVLHIAREDGAEQAADLATALRKAGTNATVEAIPGKGLKGHMEINRKLGDPDYPATPVVDAWIKKRIGI